MPNSKNTKLTSVKLLDSVYKDFKMMALQQGVKLQEVVNRSIWRYTHDSEFRKIIDNTTDLQVSGSF